ncbi:MAG: tRNA1(Val) (adenine(37)-N6)-methyltransferase [Alphaproteobacteria bacterium]
MEFTLDNFLGDKVLLKQSKDGLRATSDSVLLAALVPAQSGESVLDVGAGNGVIGCCLNARVPCRITAVEIQKNLCALIGENSLKNNCPMDLIQHNILSSTDPLKGQLFHHIVTNPPFYKASKNTRKNAEQKKAYVQDFDLEKWLNYCLKHLRAKGSFCMIHRPEMLAEILSILSKKLGNIEIFPVSSKEGESAKRILVRGFLNKKGSLTLHSPLVMHSKDNKRTQTAEKILRLAKGI